MKRSHLTLIVLLTASLSFTACTKSPPAEAPPSAEEPQAPPTGTPAPAEPNVEIISAVPMKGDVGEHVKALQRKLNEKMSAGLTVDGHFGSVTEKRVAEYQKAAGLTGTGVIGDKTLALLGLKVVAPPTVEEPPARGPSSPDTEIVLSWEKGRPEAKAWTNYVVNILSNELFKTFDSAKDAERFCPKYKSLEKMQRVHVWAEAISAVAYYESGWKPWSRMKETGSNFSKPDPITGEHVYSEGLLQLSYQDMRGYTFCVFDWERDRKLARDDRAKTILNPIVNLSCGVRIMARLIERKGTVIQTAKPLYWSVLLDNGNHKVPQITAMTKKLPFCQ